MRHSTVLELWVTHGFYADGRCADFVIDPTEPTRRVLANHRLIWKPCAGGGRLLTPVDGLGRAFLPMDPATTLAFHMLATTGDIPLFTDDAALGSVRVPVFTSHLASLDQAPLNLIEGQGPRHPPGVFARIELRVGDVLHSPADALPSRPAELGVALEAKRTRWAYYVVTDLAPHADGLRVVNEASADDDTEPSFARAPAADLGATDPEDALVARLAQQYPRLRRLRFLSTQPVPCRQSPRKRIVLRNNGDALMEPLPNPSYSNFSSLGAGADTQASVFHVVKLVNNQARG